MMQTSKETDGRERLIEAATSLFFEKGYVWVGIREIAAQAGCSLSLIKHHFGSKEGLLEHVIMADVSAMGAELAGVAMEDSDPRERIERLVDSMVDVFERHRAGLQIVLRELTQKDSPFAERLIPLIRQIVTQVVRMLEALRERDRLRTVDPEMAAVLLFAMLQFYAATYPSSAVLLGEPSGELASSLKETISTIFLHGVLTDGPDVGAVHGRT